jgi:1-acyl-sn-glycerol-3-phosphate acyltransferase
MLNLHVRFDEGERAHVPLPTRLLKTSSPLHQPCVIKTPVQTDHPAATTECGRDPLIAAITAFLARDHAPALGEIRDTLRREIDNAGPQALVALGDRLANAGTEWTYYPSDPLARRIHRALAVRVLRHNPVLLGAEHLAALAGKPVVIMANHLSYSDANLLDVLLHQAGAGALADRLTVVAGPKVYSNLRRRFSSLCFGTIKVPQSSSLSTGEAVMNAREVALAARRVIDIAHDRLRLGEALLVFAEGTRSRPGEMQRLLPGVARYLDHPGTWILPVGIAGSEALFPMDEGSLNPVPIEVRLGAPIEADALRERAGGNRQLMMDSIGLAIAAVLPSEYRGAYASASREG